MDTKSDASTRVKKIRTLVCCLPHCIYLSECPSSVQNSNSDNFDSTLLNSVHVCVDEDMYNALYTACKTGNVSGIQQILDELTVKYDAEDFPADDGRIPAAVSRLLCHRSCHNSTPLLHVAAKLGHVTAVRLLLQRGADPSLKYVIRLSICLIMLTLLIVIK